MQSHSSFQRAAKALNRMGRPVSMVQKTGMTALRSELRRSPFGGALAAAEIARDPLRYIERHTPVGQFVEGVADIMAAGHRGGARGLAYALASEETRDLVNTIGRYARGQGDWGRLLIKNLGPVGAAIDFILGRRSNLGAKSDYLGTARQILEAAGYNVIAPSMGPGAPGEPSAPGGPAGPPPPIGGGRGRRRIGGPPKAPTQPPTTGPRLPVGTFPAGLYIPMTRVSSSNVYAVGYNPETLTLRVQYLASSILAGALHGRGHRGKNRVRGTLGKTVTRHKAGMGPTYDYHGVPGKVAERIVNAGSVGGAIWDLLRVRGTVYGHRYDFELVAASRTAVVAFAKFAPPRKAGILTYVPRRAVAPGRYEPRRIRQGSQVFKSILPRQ